MTRRRAEPRCLALAIAACAMAAQAQDARLAVAAGQGGGTSIQPRLTVMETWTDNLTLSDRNKDAAIITTVSPGITIRSTGGAVRGTLDYSLNGIAYIKSDQPSRVQSSLSASGQAELISRTLFVDMRASIGQQNASAFGLQSTPTLGSQGAISNLANSNQHETGTLSVSPLLHGQLGGLASFDLRGDFSRTEVRGSSLGDSRATGGSLVINQLNGGLLAWWLRASTQEVKSSSAASNRSSTMTGGLNYRPDPDWFFTANAGRERNDFLGGSSQSGVTGGVTGQWTPTARTRVNGDWQRHNYGNSHGLTFEHRMSRSVWRLSDTVSTMLGNTGATGGVRSNYDQFFLMFASLEPDPVKRDVLVRAFLQAQGISPDAPAALGFLSTGPSRLHSQLASITLQGARTTLAAQASRSVTSRLGSNLNQGDLANTARVEQRSYSLTGSHQLTPSSSASLTASRQETTGDAGTPSARLTSLTANWNARLGTRLNVMLGGRHSRFAGTTSYSENAVYANLTQLF